MRVRQSRPLKLSMEMYPHHRAMLGKTHFAMGIPRVEPIVKDQAFCPTYMFTPSAANRIPPAEFQSSPC